MTIRNEVFVGPSTQTPLDKPKKCMKFIMLELHIPNTCQTRQKSPRLHVKNSGLDKQPRLYVRFYRLDQIYSGMEKQIQNNE